MKLSFSTRGWGDMSWEELIASALDMKFTGIEVYNLFKFPELTGRGGPFHKYQIAATVRQLRDQKLSIPCLDTSVDLSEGTDCVQTIREMMHIAQDLQVPYVVAWVSQDGDAAEARIRSNMEDLLPMAESTGVCLLIKTSGIYADTARLRSLLESYASDFTGVCNF